MRKCANPACQRSINACFSFTKSGDFIKFMKGEMNDMRELCQVCGYTHHWNEFEELVKNEITPTSSPASKD